MEDVLYSQFHLVVFRLQLCHCLVVCLTVQLLNQSPRVNFKLSGIE